jgi:DNA-binding winged helix-turn-helix (wHTH) protein/tetratricopeptide (TPR) repeat protein
METLNQSRGIAFGEFVFDPVDRILRRGDEVVGLPPKTCELLGVFIRNVGQVLSKETLMEMVWGDTFVEEGNLTIHISVLRKALGETKNENAFIQTLPRKGYRFVATLKEHIRSVAVLPFRSLVADEADPALGLGMADALITRLSRLREVLFRPTSAIRKFADEFPDALEAGRELRVDALLEGWIQQRHDRFRVTVQLVRTSNGSVLWAEGFDEPVSEFSRLQDVISEKITQALAIELTGAERRALTRTDTPNPEAYRTYLKGFYHWYKWTPAGWSRAAGYFQQAIDLDPRFAAAYAGLGDAYAAMGFGLPTRETYLKGLNATRRAIELDPDLAEAHATLGMIRFFYEYDVEGTFAALRHALRLNPASALIHDHLAITLALCGKRDEAVDAAARAVELDPLTPYITGDFGKVHYFTGQTDRAVALLEKSLDLDPNYADALNYMVKIHERAGRFTEAQSYRERLLISTGERTEADTLAATFAVGGYRASLEKRLRQIEVKAEREFVSPVDFAALHVSIGDFGAALDWLEKAAAERSMWMMVLQADPHWDSLRDEPRFKRLLPGLKKA